MTREHKLALIVGFSLVLVLGVLISDHFSKARNAPIAEDIKAPTPGEMGAATPGLRTPADGGVAVVGGVGGGAIETIRPGLVPLPGVARVPADNIAQATGGSNPAVALVATRQGREILPYGSEHSDPPGAALPPPIVTPQIPMTRYEVKEGDTLYRIAQKQYSDAKLWEKIRDYNKDKLGSGGTIHVGVTLLLPPKDVLLGKPYTPATQATGPRGSATDPIEKPAGDFREYTVKDGDTLVSIARKMLNSGKRYTEIIDANPATLSDPDALVVGMKIRIPGK